MKKILLVDSTGTILSQQDTFLKKFNITLFKTRSGTEAIEIFKKESPDVAVLDFNLPDISFPELCKKIFILKKIPVLMMSEQGNDKIVEACRKAGIDDFIFKPFTSRELLDKIGNLLNIAERRDFRILMKIKVEGYKGGSFFMGSTIDISTSGLLIETHNKDIQIGDKLEFDFFLPWKLKAVKIAGEVKRKIPVKDDYHYGILFRGLDPILRTELSDYIKKKSRLES